MKPIAMVKLGDRTFPLEECEWVFYNSCGCPLGLMVAETVDEEVAWLDMYGKRDTPKQKRLGVTAKLLPRDGMGDTLKRMREKCTHPPVPNEKQCEQCGRKGITRFKIYPATEFTPRIIVCENKGACQARWPKKSESELDALL